MSHDALIETLSGYIETSSDGVITYRNQAGERHRVGGPAEIDPNGAERWYQNGLPHRTDGPAVTRADGAQFWYLNGHLHRMDGPAVVYPNSQKFWFIDDCAVPQEKFNEYVSRIAEEVSRNLAS